VDRHIEQGAGSMYQLKLDVVNILYTLQATGGPAGLRVTAVAINTS